jgi:glycosyltransferase involved in cell wall biosynthesis
MKLLIITQAVDVNNPILGFFHGWIEEFSKHCEKITVICLEKGEYHLSENVKVLSLGKETFNIQHSTFNILKKLKYSITFLRCIWVERKNYDEVFVHMNPIYVVLGGIFWKFWSKKISLWYTHKFVDWKLKIAEKLCDNIFSASRESFRMKTDKLQIVGHGIPIELFKNPHNLNYKKGDKLRILSVGRITKIKNLDILISACGILKKKGLDFEVSLVGPIIGEENRKYFEYLEQLILKNNLKEKIKFLGGVSNNKITEYYWRNDLSLNPSSTGGVDKVVLESMASGLLVMTSTIAFEEYFRKYKDVLMFKERDAEDLAERIINLISRTDLEDIRNFLISSVEEKANLKKTILRIIAILNG